MEINRDRNTMKKIKHFLNLILAIGFILGIIFYINYSVVEQKEKLKPDFEYSINELQGVLSKSFPKDTIENICKDNPYLKDLEITRNENILFKYSTNAKELKILEFENKFSNFFIKKLFFRKTVTVNNYQVKMIFTNFDKQALIKLLVTIIIASSIYIGLVLLIILLQPVSKDSIDSKLSTNFIVKINKRINSALTDNTDLSICFIKTNSSKLFSTKFHYPFSILDDKIKFANGVIESTNQFISILIPKSNFKETFKLMEAFSNSINQIDPKIVLSIGISSLNNRHKLSASTFIQEANEALFKALNEKKSSVYGFKADPKKYSELF